MGKKLYNLGFGDYDVETDMVSDDSNSNNGDHYKVFNTVLSTIPNFFYHNPMSMLMVQGSDSKPGFKDHCRLTYKKKCQGGKCRNSDRRIRIYRRYVDQNYNTLIGDYIFYGAINVDNHIVLEYYEMGKHYNAVFLLKKEA